MRGCKDRRVTRGSKGRHPNMYTYLLCWLILSQKICKFKHLHFYHAEKSYY